jgi:hypothetical protein
VTSALSTLDDLREVVLRGRANDRNWMVDLAVLGAFLVFVAVWQLSGPGDDFGAIFTGWAGAVVVLATVFITATIANRCRAGLRLGCVFFTRATMSGLIYWNMSGGLDTFKLHQTARVTCLRGSRP